MRWGPSESVVRRIFGGVAGDKSDGVRLDPDGPAWPVPEPAVHRINMTKPHAK
jgi:hypothetical protein